VKEATIRKKAIELLTAEGWVCWYPKKVKFQETDIFGVFDLICARGSEIKLIQLTTLPNLSARRRKIRRFLKEHNLQLKYEIWAYSKKNRRFKIEKLTD